MNKPTFLEYLAIVFLCILTVAFIALPQIMKLLQHLAHR